MRGDRQVADHQEQERADELGQVRTCCHPNPPRFRPPGAVRGPRVPAASTSVEAVPRGAQQEGVAPGPAQDLEQLQPIDRGAHVRPDGVGAVPLQQHDPGGRLRASAMAAAIRAASSSLPISPAATNGTRGSSSAVSGRIAGSGTSPATVRAIDAGRWAWATAAASGRAARTARWMARSEVGARPDGDRCGALIVAEPELDEVVRLELVLAPAGRGDQQPGVVEADGQVALGGGDQPARAEPPSALEQRLPGRLQVHPAMLRGVTPRRRVRPRRPAGGVRGAGSALSSTTTWQSSQRTSVRSGSMVAGPAHQGQSVVMSFAPSRSGSMARVSTRVVTASVSRRSGSTPAGGRRRARRSA